MISTKGLQVGNWLQCITELGELYRFQITAFDFYTVEKGYVNHWEYVPLTPEILEKAGFVKNEDYFEFRKHDFWIREVGVGVFKYVSGIQRLGSGFKYVHHLQNMFFALIGEELTLQL